MLVQMLAGLVQRHSHAHDGRKIFRTGPLAPFLTAALNEVLQPQGAFADIEDARALGTVELMARQGQQIDVLGRYVNVQVARCLDGVGMEQDALFPADCADLRNGLNGADFVVGVHNGDQRRVGPDGVSHFLPPNNAVRMDRQQGDLPALALQLLQGV